MSSANVEPRIDRGFLVWGESELRYSVDGALGVMAGQENGSVEARMRLEWITLQLETRGLIQVEKFEGGMYGMTRRIGPEDAARIALAYKVLFGKEGGLGGNEQEIIWGQIGAATQEELEGVAKELGIVFQNPHADPAWGRLGQLDQL